ncbi:hypothetical protein B2A_08098, partial [mine drainage metagenome]
MAIEEVDQPRHEPPGRKRGRGRDRQSERLAGQADTLRRERKLIEKSAERARVVSQVPKMANLVKLSGNFLIASVIESRRGGA